MSRGGLLLRCVREKHELAYIGAAAFAAPRAARGKNRRSLAVVASA